MYAAVQRKADAQIESDQSPTPVSQGTEEAFERRRRMYGAEGGPLMTWLYDEAEIRGHDSHAMAYAIGTTTSYLNSLRNGHKRTECIGQAMVERMAAYLGVPPIVVKIIGGALPPSDFVCADQSEQAALLRAMQRIERDPVVRPLLQTSLSELPTGAQRVVAALYAESSGQDVFAHCRIPDIVQHLQRASAIHEASMREAAQKEPRH